MSDPADLTATEARRMIGRRQLSPVELADACIAGFWPKTYQILQFRDTKKRTSENKINVLRVVQAGLFESLGPA